MQTNYKYLIVLLSLAFLLAACGGEGDFKVAGSDEEATGEDSTYGRANPEIDMLVNAGPPMDKDPGTVPAPIPSPDSDERRGESEFNDKGCCDDVTAVTDCCCEEILNRFKELFKKDGASAAMELPSSDVYYKACDEQKADFDGKVQAFKDDFYKKKSE